MAFKRHDGFSGSVPQKFIDKSLPKCPMCGTDDPQWTLDMQMGFIKLNRYLFKCAKCDAILSSTVADATGIGRTALTTVGLAKAFGGKKISAVYMKVDSVGNQQVTKTHENVEYTLDELKEMAQNL